MPDISPRQPLIRMENIVKEFPGVRALDGVDLAIRAGEYVTLTGPSGSGKSTLLNVLGCLDRPDSGSYRLDGIEVRTLDDTAASRVRNRRIGFVFQSFHLLPRLTVLENVLLPMRFSEHPDEQAPRRAQTLLARVGLGDRMGHRPGELSGGQMQRAAIARALVLKPALLLADGDGLVHPAADRENLGLEHAVRRRVGDHQRGERIAVQFVNTRHAIFYFIGNFTPRLITKIPLNQYRLL